MEPAARVARTSRLIVWLVVMSVITTVLVGCTTSPEDEQVVEVGGAGGVVGRANGPAQVEVPAGQAPEGTTIRIDPGNERAPAPTALKGAALLLGEAVEITPSSPLQGALVRLPIDPSELPRAGDRVATIANAFISVYNEHFQAWVPLMTTYDPGSRQLVAQTPHFSWFRKHVIDPAKDWWDSRVDGVQALLRFSVSLLNERKKEIDCPSANARWVLENKVSEIETCVEPNADGSLALRVENGLRLMYDAVPPDEFTIGITSYDRGNKFIPTIMRYLTLPMHEVATPGRGRSEITVPADVARSLEAPGSSFRIDMQPDQLGMALDSVLIAIGWLPQTRYVFEALFRLEARGVLLRLSERALTARAFLAELMVQLRAELVVGPGGVTETATLFNDAFNCVTATLDGATEQGEGALDRAIRVGKDCASSAVQLANKALSDQATDILRIVAAVPDTFNAVAALYDGARVGGQHFGGQFSFTFRRPGVATPLANVQWERVVRPIDCIEITGQPLGEIRSVWQHDVTGDGRADAFIRASCYSSTSSNPEGVYVYDGATDPSSPVLIGVLGIRDRGDYLRNIEVAFDGTTVTLTADALSETAPLCCPDLRVTQSFSWNGNAFIDGEKKVRGK